MAFQATSSPPVEIKADGLPKDFVSSLTTLFGHGCEQRLLRGKYGITAFDMREGKGKGKRKVAVYSHGLGQCYGTSDGPLVQTLVDGGYTVVAYSFYGHGWSYAGDEVMGVGGGCCCGPMPLYDSVVHISQVKELLEHVMEKDEVLDLWVGHSTGGVVGVYMAAANVWPIRTFGLISPAFWAEKPCLSKVIEKSSVLTRVIANSCLLKLGEGDYLKNNASAFGKDMAGKHLYPAKEKEFEAKIKKNFAAHPQLLKCIASISMTFLPSMEMPGHRSMFKELAERKDGPAKIVIVWGTKDIVVPYEHAQHVVAWNPERIKLVSPILGHESVGEDPRQCSQIIVDELKDV